MTVEGIRRALGQARSSGTVDPQKVDRILIEARDNGGLNASERKELLEAADGFDDDTKQRVLSHVAAMGQQNAWVNVEAAGQVASVKGRYATLTTDVPGLSARLGLFDSCLGMSGRARADGVLKLNVEGTALQLDVKKGETAAQVLERARAQLPTQVCGVLLEGSVSPYDPASFTGAAPQSDSTAAHLMLFKPEALGLRPGETPLRVVVTGYGKFFDITDNPSAKMAQKLAEQGVRGAVVEYRRLPVTTRAVDGFIAEMKKSPPDVILSLGVTPGKSQVEENPANFIHRSEDGEGKRIRERKIRENGPELEQTDLPVDTIDWALSGFGGDRRVGTSQSDPEYSTDTSYLCNYIGYSLANEFKGSEATTAGFMHINTDTPADQMQAVLEAVTARQLEWRRSQSTPPIA